MNKGGGQKALLAPGVLQVPAAKNNPPSKAARLRWHILLPFNVYTILFLRIDSQKGNQSVKGEVIFKAFDIKKAVF